MKRHRNPYRARGEYLGRHLMARLREFVETEVQPLLDEIGEVAPERVPEAAWMIANVFRDCAVQIERQLPSRN